VHPDQFDVLVSILRTNFASHSAQATLPIRSLFHSLSFYGATVLTRTARHHAESLGPVWRTLHAWLPRVQVAKLIAANVPAHARLDRHFARDIYIVGGAESPCRAAGLKGLPEFIDRDPNITLCRLYLRHPYAPFLAFKYN